MNFGTVYRFILKDFLSKINVIIHLFLTFLFLHYCFKINFTNSWLKLFYFHTIELYYKYSLCKYLNKKNLSIFSRSVHEPSEICLRTVGCRGLPLQNRWSEVSREVKLCEKNCRPNDQFQINKFLIQISNVELKYILCILISRLKYRLILFAPVCRILFVFDAQFSIYIRKQHDIATFRNDFNILKI